jgi:tryptophan synthase alpha chain
MSTIDAAFQNKPIFMPYFPLGYPDLPTSIDVIEALGKSGADLIEVGLPFSDPLADGPVIQQATQIALKNGVTVKSALEAVQELRRRGVAVPLVLMGYYNPLLAFGLQRFVDDAEAAGADGFIVPDLPPEEAADLEAALHGNGAAGRTRNTSGGTAGPLPLIRMLAPTTPPERMERVASGARGFLYLVSVTGVTGAREAVAEGLGDLIRRVREHASAPVCVGFGISSPAQARAVGALADGVIIGSACVRAVGGSSRPVETARALAREYKEALG